MEEKAVEPVEAIRLSKVAEVEYKTLRAEIINNIGLIIKILIGSHSAMAILYAYLLSQENVSPYAFLFPLLIIAPAYLVTVAMFHVVTCIYTYMIVFLKNLQWENRLHQLYKNNSELEYISVIPPILNRFTIFKRLRVKYYDTVLVSYRLSAALCLLIFIFQAEINVFIMLFTSVGLCLILCSMLTKQLDDIKTKLIKNWEKIESTGKN